MSNVLASLLVELGINTAAFAGGLDKATYKAKESAKEIGRAFEGLGKDIGGIFSQFGGLGTVFGETLQGMGGALSKVAGQMGSLGGLGGAAAIGLTAVGAAAVATSAALSELAVQGAEVVHSLDMVAAKTGISTSDLQTLQAAGSTVGVSLDEMVMAFRRFDQALLSTGRGSAQATVTLKALGVTSTDNKEALYQVADAFEKMADGPRKAADAVALFGRAGLNMIPFLDKGRAGLKEFEDLVDRYGPKIGKDAKEADENYLIAQTKLNLAWDAFKVSAEESVLPSLTKIITALAEAERSTHGFGQEVSGHFMESVKAGIKGAEDAWNSAPWWQKNPLGMAGIIVGGAIGGISAKAESHGPSAEEQQAKADAAASEKQALAEAKALKVAEDYFKLVKEGGPAAANLAKTKEEIAEAEAIGTVASYDQAAALQKQIPLLEKLAKQEKERQDFLLNPPHLAPAKDALDPGNTLAKTNEQLVKQSAIAAQTDSTTASTLMLNAAEQAKNDILGKQLAYTEEIAQAQAELRNKDLSPSAKSMLQQRIAQVQALAATLDKEAPDIIAKQQAIAVGTAINDAAKQMNAELPALAAQRDAILETSAAFAQGADAIRGAAIDKAVEKQVVAVKAANDAYNQFANEHKDLTGVMNPFLALLDEENKKLTQAKEIHAEIYDADIAAKIQREVTALQAETVAWRAMTDAADKGSNARVAAEVTGARARASAQGLSPGEINQAGDEALVKAQQGLITTAAQAGAQMDLVGAYNQEIEKLELIKQIYSSNAQIVAFADAQELEAGNKAIKAWDDEMLAYGNFKQKVSAGLQEIAQDGQNLGQSIAKAGVTAFTSWEDQLSKLVVTGKANFKGILTNLEENVTQSGIKSVTGTLASGVGKLFPSLSGLTNSLTGAKMDGSDSAHALWVQLAASGATGSASSSGGGSTGGVTGILSGANGFLGKLLSGGGILKSIGAFLPHLAGGGDVVPGESYVVGERHEEIFSPSVPGRVIPNAGGSVTVVQHLHVHGVTDADSFKKSSTQISGMMGSAAQRAASRLGR